MHTMTAQLQVEDIADGDVYHPKEALVLSLKLALIKDLHSYNGRVFDHTNMKF